MSQHRPQKITPNITPAVSRLIHGAMRQDDKLVVITAYADGTPAPDSTHGSDELRAMRKEFGPWRVMHLADTPGSILGAVLGAAEGGLKVVADLTDLADGGLLANELGQLETGLRGLGGGGTIVLRTRVSHDTSGLNLVAAAAAQAGFLAVALPAAPVEAQGLMIEALRMNRPVLFLEQAVPTARDELPDVSPSPIPFGCAKTLRRGGDLTIVAFAPEAPAALAAADLLERSDAISCDVIDPRTLAPLDLRLITESVERTGRLILLEPEGLRSPIVGDIAARMAETAFSALLGPISRAQVAHSAGNAGELADALRAAYARRG